ncbi:MAG: Nif3-like dinuclear metal center hexameric protein [Calditrichaeota bacterium]|jgi:dinuclear metal center YbgI/SA1388 family protein|nr:Nif3-like dinuclear metal center hexameric protein [Calditrichota bacterium]
MKRTELGLYLADFLDTDSYSDYCVNGLQVEGNKEVKSIVTGVSVSERLFQAAIEKGADTIIVHHGLFWRNSPNPFKLTGITYNRVRLLIEHNINLFAYHLPLDSHPKIGNNALIAKALGLKNRKMIEFPDISAGMGELTSPLSINEFHGHADKLFEAEGLMLPGNQDSIQKVFIISGGGGNDYQDAYSNGADVYVTGELEEHSVRGAEELGLALYAPGHYNSEKWGIRELGNHLEREFGFTTDFVDIPNPI